MIAYDYPILGVFWTMLWLFLWIAWIVILFRVIADLFRSKDLGGWGKALWIIFVILAPFLGVFVYVIARGHSMHRARPRAGPSAAGGVRRVRQGRRRPPVGAARRTSSPSSPTSKSAA